MKIPTGRDISNGEARPFESIDEGTVIEGVMDNDRARKETIKPPDDETTRWHASWRLWGAPGSIL